jgi:hypothetical protein
MVSRAGEEVEERIANSGGRVPPFNEEKREEGPARQPGRKRRKRRERRA